VFSNINVHRIVCLILQIGVDLIGPLPKTGNANRYIVTVTDYYSKWAEAKALPSKHGAGVAQFLSHLFLQ